MAMINLFRRKKPKFIGKVVSNLHWENHRTGYEADFDAHICFFMTADGKRSISIEKSMQNYANTGRWSAYNEAVAWTRGGGWPKEFVEEDDTLGEMLIRLIDKKLTE